jgi:hypothetical protein
MNDIFVFRGFEFREMCVYRRCFSRVRVYVEKRCIEHSQENGKYCVTGR